MGEIKTKPTKVDPAAFIMQVESDRRRSDSQELVAMMKEITGEPPKMWGPGIIGFGRYHYRYESGHEGDMVLTGFSPRKQSLVLYVGPGLQDKKLMTKLGKYKTGKSCLYINKLDDIDRDVLRDIIRKSVEEMRKSYKCE